MRVILFCACVCALRGSVAFEETLVDSLRGRLLHLERKLWQNVEGEKQNEVTTSQGTDVQLTRAFYSFDSEIKAASSNNTLLFLEKSWLWSKTQSELAVISDLYQVFIKFAARQAPGNVPSPVQEWIDLAEIVLMGTKTSVLKSFNQIGELVIHGDLFRKALEDANPELCNLQQSPHQLLYNMYSTISLTEIKGYAMMQFSWMLLRIYGKGNFTQEANLMRQRYEERTSLTIASIKNAMNQAKRDMYRCDPPDHVEGETFVQITRFLQGYIENEVDMNPDGTCRENCAFYTLTKNYGCFKDQYCSRQAQCEGRIINCQYIDSDMWVCPATSKSKRRYEWIEYENGRTLGHPGSCMRGTSKVDSWWRWNLLHCSYCMCLCEESQHMSDRYFSLREVLSNVVENKIVTGLRFTKVGRVIHLQISEGVLGARATVEPTSLSWRPVEKIEVNNWDLEGNPDYHMLTYENRAMDLDELEGPTGHVLTGVRFRMIGAHLHFEIRTTPFNYTSGKLFAEKSVWTSNDNTEGAETPRKRLNLDRPDVPTRFGAMSQVDSNHDSYLEFSNTDFDADAAQTTVPFIDTQSVEPTTPVPLTGAGIIHKGTKGSGGFIAPKIFTYNYSPHMHIRVPESNEYELEKNVEIVPTITY